MTPRLTLAAVFVISLIGGVAAKEKAASKTPPKRAASDSSQNKTTLLSIAQFILKNGNVRPFDDTHRPLLGYASALTDTKAMRYKAELSSDKLEHAIYVVTDNGQPKELVIDQTLVTGKGSDRFVVGRSFRVDTSGKLLGAIKGSGKVGLYKNQRADISDQETKKKFDEEFKFLLEQMDVNKLSK